MPLLQTTYQNESAKTDGIVLFTVNMKDSAQAIKTFFDSKSYTLSALLDSGAKVTQTYGISGIPATFFIDRGSIIRHIKDGAFLSMAELQISLNRIN
jgi:peroxiredoxin